MGYIVYMYIYWFRIKLCNKNSTPSARLQVAEAMIDKYKHYGIRYIRVLVISIACGRVASIYFLGKKISGSVNDEGNFYTIQKNHRD